MPLILAIEPGALLIVLPATAVAFLSDVRALATARGLWMTVLLSSLLAVLTLACAIPHRPPGA